MIDTEFVNWLLIGGAAVFAMALGLNQLALVNVRAKKRARAALKVGQADPAFIAAENGSVTILGNIVTNTNSNGERATKIFSEGHNFRGVSSEGQFVKFGDHFAISLGREPEAKPKKARGAVRG